MLKHSKKKNAGIIYEQLIALTTRLAANKQHKEADFVVNIIKKHFNKKTALGKERSLFEYLLKSEGYNEKTSEKVLKETLQEAAGISQKQLEKEKLALIDKINKELGSELYNIPLKEYKDLASVQILFNESRNKNKYTTPKERVKIQNNILKKISEKKEPQKESGIDNFTYKVLINKFNKKYGQLMNEDQKDILKGWVNYLSDSNEEEFQKLVETKVEKLKKEIGKHLNLKKHKNKDYKILLDEAYSKVNSLNKESINEEFLYEVMRFFDVYEDLELVGKEEKNNEQKG